MTLGFGSALCRKILVVDNCAEVRALIRRLLERSGLHVVDARLYNGFEIASAQDGTFALVITNEPGPFISLGLRVVYLAAVPDPAIARHCVASLNKPFRND